MTEIHFVVEEPPEGGYIAKAVSDDIFTEADDISGLYVNVCDAIRCHFGEDKEPTLIRTCST
jgi:hypothetical protein